MALRTNFKKIVPCKSCILFCQDKFVVFLLKIMKRQIKRVRMCQEWFILCCFVWRSPVRKWTRGCPGGCRWRNGEIDSEQKSGNSLRGWLWGRHQSSRGTRTPWHRPQGNQAAHILDPMTPGRGPLRSTPAGCQSHPDQQIKIMLWIDQLCIIKNIATTKSCNSMQNNKGEQKERESFTLHASLPPSMYPAHIIRREIMPG